VLQVDVRVARGRDGEHTLFCGTIARRTACQTGRWRAARQLNPMVTKQLLFVI
jgi:hypothetical protein